MSHTRGYRFGNPMSQYPPAWPGSKSTESLSPIDDTGAAEIAMRWIAWAAIGFGGLDVLGGAMVIAELSVALVKGNATLPDAVQIGLLVILLLGVLAGAALGWGGIQWRNRDARAFAWIQWGSIVLLSTSLIGFAIQEVLFFNRMRGIGSGMSVTRPLPWMTRDFFDTLGRCAPPALLLFFARQPVLRRYLTGGPGND
jgi:hypothetical protein